MKTENVYIVRSGRSYIKEGFSHYESGTTKDINEAKTWKSAQGAIDASEWFQNNNPVSVDIESVTREIVVSTKSIDWCRYMSSYDINHYVENMLMFRAFTTRTIENMQRRLYKAGYDDSTGKWINDQPGFYLTFTIENNVMSQLRTYKVPKNVY
jgi:hypothetical protein